MNESRVLRAIFLNHETSQTEGSWDVLLANAVRVTQPPLTLRPLPDNQRKAMFARMKGGGGGGGGGGGQRLLASPPPQPPILQPQTPEQTVADMQSAAASQQVPAFDINGKPLNLAAQLLMSQPGQGGAMPPASELVFAGSGMEFDEKKRRYLTFDEVKEKTQKIKAMLGQAKLQTPPKKELPDFKWPSLDDLVSIDGNFVQRIKSAIANYTK